MTPPLLPEVLPRLSAKIKGPGLARSLKAIFKPESQDIQVVQGIDLRVEKGEVIAFLGPNGAGKLSTIKMLTRL